jgi:gas vesicle protein
MSQSEDKNALVYLLAGFGLGALVGAAAGLLFAPKPGSELRGDIGNKVRELKGKTNEWIAERRAKKAAIEAAEEVGA